MNTFFSKLRTKFRLLVTDLPVLYLASKDKRTPVTTKLLLGLTIVYFFSPIDLVPDFIPVAGMLDDLVMVPLLITLGIKTVPTNVLADVRARLSRTRSRLKTVLLVLFLLCVGGAAAYYGYRFLYQNNEASASY